MKLQGQVPLINTKTKSPYRFEFYLNNEVVSLNYRIVNGNEIELAELIKPKDWCNSSISDALIERVLIFIRQSGLKLVGMGNEVEKFVRDHPEYNRLFD